jgi:predicted nucleotidyltransferase
MDVAMTTREHNIALPMEQILQFCRRNPIRKLSLFGSVLREDFTEKSDVDFLVEFDNDSRVGLFELVGMQFELEAIIGRRADLRTAGDFPDRFRFKVLESAELIYEREN